MADRDRPWLVGEAGLFGRGLQRYVDAGTWSELEQTYTGADPEANWTALFRTADLFRRVGIETGRALGYTYPHAVDAQVSGYLEQIRQLE